MIFGCSENVIVKGFNRFLAQNSLKGEFKISFLQADRGIILSLGQFLDQADQWSMPAGIGRLDRPCGEGRIDMFLGEENPE